MEQHTSKKKCPECGSTDLEPKNNPEPSNQSLPPFSTEQQINSDTWKCKNCNYLGTPIPSKEEVDLSSEDYKEIRICPKCNSKKVEIEKEIAAIGGGHNNPDTWHCKECGYTGIMPTILEKTEKTKKKEDSKEKYENSLAILLLTLIIFLILTVLLQ